jgi:RNA polymerase sigma-70 factor (ECF subfamily)
MDEWAAHAAAAPLVAADAELEREFEQRLKESATLAFRVAYGVLRHREDAEDVAQEACVRAYRSFRTLRDRDRFRGWLVRMTWRLAIDRQRNDRRRIVREQRVEAAPALADGEELAAARERRARVWEAVDALPPKLRVVVILANIEGHNTREVASLLGLPEGTVKSRLSAARRWLAEKLRWMADDRKKP